MISDVSALSIDGLHAWVATLALTAHEREIGQSVLDELAPRDEYLRDVGLGYLTLDRQTRTLSGGEAQRIALSNALGSRLVGHALRARRTVHQPAPRDTDRLLGLLHRLRDGGNTVVVVEHDIAAIRQADFMLELGPGPGRAWREGGARRPDHGASALAHRPVPHWREAHRGAERAAGGGAAMAQAARRARCTTCRAPTATSHWARSPPSPGVSGSGKSTLIHDVLYRQLEGGCTAVHSAKSHLGEAVGEGVVTARNGCRTCCW
jgi:excinuclease ABC subunit A